MTFITIQNKKIQLVLPISIIIFISLLICNDLTDGKTFLYSFIAFGICMILVLWLLIISVYSINSDMYYDKKKIFISIIFISVNWLMYLYINYACDSIKIWDYACYYRIALAMRDQFSSGYGSALKWVLATIYNDEYNSFLLLFTIFPFEITSRTIECFINAYYVVYIIPTLLIWMSIGNRILKKCGKDKDLVSYCVICVAVAFFPLLHATATKGMPDVGGVLFAGLLILIFWEYDFIKFDLKRLMIGMVVSICLFLFRRWYTFWLIAFYTTYFTGCIVFGFLNKKSY
ncbi:MAG: hypothetical protein K2P14_09360, partial [Anaeroplasmataceae bacterium]|nr:hypothetical protein [Anaeroplasmataceae bacterium]